MSKKTNTGPRKSLLAGASVLAAAAALAGTPAFAQDNSNTASNSDDEAIVVTGTRLVRQDFEAISPVTTVGSEQLELTATMTTESLLNELPQILPGNTRTSNNSGGEDFATVDIFGLGPQRTLVLVNGERIPASSTDGVANINTIPTSLISRIEVVTGGASAVYGSDAIAGVVNFVLKDDYEGAEISATYGSEMETGNAQEFEANMLVGGNFANGRGNMTAYASYYNRNGVLQSEYDWSRVAAGACYDSRVGGGYTFTHCDSSAAVAGHGGVVGGGSGTPPWGWIHNDAANAFAGLSAAETLAGNNNFNAAVVDNDCDGVADGTAFDTGNLSFDAAGALSPRNNGGACGVPDRAAGSSRYNYAPDNFIIIPAERVAMTVSGHYDISDSVRLSVLMNYTNSRQEVQLAATPATSLTVTLTPAMQALISGSHPDLEAALNTRPDPLAPFVEDFRTSQVGTRNGFSENNAFYFIASLTGSLGDNWDWSLSGSYGQVLDSTHGLNSINATAFRQGLAGCQQDDGLGTPLGINALPGCVPIDIFGAGLLTDAMQSFLRVNTFNQTTVEENRLGGFVRGDLFHLPAGPVSTVFGFDYRDTYAASVVDNEQRTGNIYGFNAVQDAGGEVDVYELYTEFAIPLISEQPFAYYLGLEGGYRRSNYSSVGDVETWKAGGEYAPTSWLRFRGIYNKATRAPSVFELFQNGDQGFPAYTEPCRDGNGDGIPDLNANASPLDDVSQAQCTADGVTYAVGTPFAANNSQVQAFAFGNRNLAPETADTWTAGFVLQPDWFPVGDLRASVDYYHIDLADAIISEGAQFWLNQCYTASVNSAAACARVTREPGGQVDSVITSVANAASENTSGWNVQIDWSIPIGPGQLTLNELYSKVDTFAINGSDFAGTTGGGIGSGIFDWKSVLSATYSVGDWTLFGRWSYVPELTDTTFEAVGDTAPAASYVDMSARWNLTDAFSLTGVVNNVFDDAPPETSGGMFGGGQGNTDPQTYRVLGRSFFITGRYRF